MAFTCNFFVQHFAAVGPEGRKNGCGYATGGKCPWLENFLPLPTFPELLQA